MVFRCENHRQWGLSTAILMPITDKMVRPQPSDQSGAYTLEAQPETNLQR
jgi:hypothetical protein